MTIDLSKHRHGGQPAHLFNKFSLPQTPVIDFSVNISPFGLPRSIIEKWPGFMNSLSEYPKPGIGAEYYQKRFGLDNRCILLGNGSIELIYLAPRAFRLKRVVVVVPSFFDYERAAVLADARVEYLTLERRDGFKSLNLERLKAALAENDAIVLGNPNNPTGTIWQAPDLLALADQFPGKKIFVDEAFIQFTENQEALTLLTPARIRLNIVVFHSLTKFYAIAGIRLGAAVSAPKTIEVLSRFQSPWSVNSVAGHIADCIADVDEFDYSVKLKIKEERARMQVLLESLPGITCFASTANFFLCQWTRTSQLDDLLLPLLKEGIFVRDCRNFKGLEEGYFRFAVRSRFENNLLIKALKDICNG